MRLIELFQKSLRKNAITLRARPFTAITFFSNTLSVTPIETPGLMILIASLFPVKCAWSITGASRWLSTATRARLTSMCRSSVPRWMRRSPLTRRIPVQSRLPVWLVNTIASAGSPAATSVPSTWSLVPGAASTRTPGSIVSVTPRSTITSSIRRNGLSDRLHVVSAEIRPCTTVCARAGGESKLTPTEKQIAATASLRIFRRYFSRTPDEIGLLEHRLRFSERGDPSVRATGRASAPREACWFRERSLRARSSPA